MSYNKVRATILTLLSYHVQVVVEPVHAAIVDHYFFAKLCFGLQIFKTQTGLVCTVKPYDIDVGNILAFVFSVVAEKIFNIVKHMLFTRGHKYSVPV